MSTSSQNIDKELLDNAAKLAAYAKLSNLNQTQINNYIEFFNSLKGGKESYLYFAAYIARQGSRIIVEKQKERQRKEKSGKRRNKSNNENEEDNIYIRKFIENFVQIMVNAYKNNMDKEKIVIMLNTFKWLFESVKNLEISFDEKNIQNIQDLTIEIFLEKLADKKVTR